MRRHDARVAAASGIGFGEFFAVEPEGDFFGGGVYTLADDAFIGEDGLNVPVELGRGRALRG